MTNPHFGSATVLSPVRDTEQTLMPAYPCPASWIFESSRLSFPLVIRQSPSLAFIVLLGATVNNSETPTPQSRRPGKHRWKIKTDITQRKYITGHSCVQSLVERVQEWFRGCGQLGFMWKESGVGGKVSWPSAHCCMLLIANNGKGKCYFRSSCQDRWLKWSWGIFSNFF